jgi:hypothetical protein
MFENFRVLQPREQVLLVVHEHVSKHTSCRGAFCNPIQCGNDPHVCCLFAFREAKNLHYRLVPFFVAVVNVDRQKIVQFSHPSVREYLISHRIAIPEQVFRFHFLPWLYMPLYMPLRERVEVYSCSLTNARAGTNNRPCM